MTLQEQKTIISLFYAAIDNDKLHLKKTFEDFCFHALVWRFNYNKKWANERLKKIAIRKEKNKVFEELDGNGDAVKINLYIKTLTRYLFIRFIINHDFSFVLKEYAKEKEEKLKNGEKIKVHLLDVYFKNPKKLFYLFVREQNKISYEPDNRLIQTRIKRLINGIQSDHDKNIEAFYFALERYYNFLVDLEKGKTLERPDRIQTMLSKETIQHHFLQLKNVDVKEEQIHKFLQANFEGFEPQITKTPLKVTCSQAAIRRLLYDFYELERLEGSQVEAALFHRLLKDNFNKFENTALVTIKAHFSDYAPKDYPFE